MPAMRSLRISTPIVVDDPRNILAREASKMSQVKLPSPAVPNKSIACHKGPSMKSSTIHWMALLHGFNVSRTCLFLSPDLGVWLC